MNNLLKQYSQVLFMMMICQKSLCASPLKDAPDQTINTAEIVSKTVKAMTLNESANCFRYHPPTRFCVWISPEGKNLTPYLDHYLPDLVVSAFSNQDNPWDEIRTSLDDASNTLRNGIFKIDASGGQQDYLNTQIDHVFFKEVDIIGNPALLGLNRIPYALLPTTIQPAFPYYQSMLDHAMWRGTSTLARVEELDAIKESLLHHVGQGVTDWGGIYPHQGFVSGLNDGKATQVIASRAADLLSKNSKFYPHVVKSISNDCGQACHAAPMQENSQEVLWQMIYPEEKACSVLGVEDALTDKPTEHHAYVWIIWRHYEGCVQGDGVFAGVTP